MKKIINGNLEKYKVEVRGFGLSYAAPYVYVRRKLPIIPFYTWRYVWRGKEIPSLTAEKMLPDSINEWFFMAVEEYENYKAKWRDDGVTV